MEDVIGAAGDGQGQDGLLDSANEVLVGTKTYTIQRSTNPRQYQRTTVVLQASDSELPASDAEKPKDDAEDEGDKKEGGQ